MRTKPNVFHALSRCSRRRRGGLEVNGAVLQYLPAQGPLALAVHYIQVGDKYQTSLVGFYVCWVLGGGCRRFFLAVSSLHAISLRVAKLVGFSLVCISLLGFARGR